MPIVQPSLITRPEDIVEFLADYLKASTLPLAYVAKYDEPRMPDYPAVQIIPGPYTKELYGTHTWLLTLRADLFVMHAKMTSSRESRSREDLELATKVVAYVERDLSFGRKIIAGWVTNEQPFSIPPRSEKGAAVISTRLSWAGTTEARF